MGAVVVVVVLVAVVVVLVVVVVVAVVVVVVVVGVVLVVVVAVLWLRSTTSRLCVSSGLFARADPGGLFFPPCGGTCIKDVVRAPLSRFFCRLSANKSVRIQVR